MIILHCLKPTMIVVFRQNHVGSFTVDTQDKIINRMTCKYIYQNLPKTVLYTYK